MNRHGRESCHTHGIVRSEGASGPKAELHKLQYSQAGTQREGAENIQKEGQRNRRAKRLSCVSQLRINVRRKKRSM